MARLTLRAPIAAALFLLLGLTTVGFAEPVKPAKMTILMDLLGIEEVAQIMQTEGLAYAEDLNTDMLEGQGGAFWNEQVAKIYDTARMTETVRQGIEADFSDSAADGSIAFFSTPLGRRIIELENAARLAMVDEDVEDLARGLYVDEIKEGTPRLKLIRAFVEANDLLERNVSGALSSNYQFLRGLTDGDATEMTDDDIIADVWSQEAEIRDDTTSWLYGYLLMAYQPLSDDDLQAYIGFSETPEGRALNAALFAGFDRMYLDISYALGRALSMNMQSSDL